MTAFIIFLISFICIIIFIIQGRRIAKNEEHIKDLESYVKKLNEKINAYIFKNEIQTEQKEEIKPIIEVKQVIEPKKEEIQTYSAINNEKLSEEKPIIIETTIKPQEIKKESEQIKEELPKKQEKKHKFRDFIKRIFKLNDEQFDNILQNIEKQFAENWIGVIGSIVLVIGLGILGIYAALKLEAFFRFLMLVGVSILLFGSYLFLKRKNFWLKLSSWVRSTAGAIFLFACLGSGGITGLKWINDPLFALILLSIGIIVNLYFAFIGKTQTFASLHVLLSLLSISFAPQGLMTIIIATIIVAFGLILSYKEKWEFHQLLTIVCYFIFIIYYKLNIKEISFVNSIVNLSLASLIVILSILVHYRDVYANKKFELVPFLVHLSTWAFYGIELALIAPKENFTTIIIGVASIAIFVLARFAKKLNIRWLYITDTLTALLTAFIAVITLFRWEFSINIVISLLFIETLIFSLVMIIEREKKLFFIGNILQNIILFSLLFYDFVIYKISNDIFEITIIHLIISLFAIGFQIFNLKHNDKDYAFCDFEFSNKIMINMNIVFFAITSLFAISVLILNGLSTKLAIKESDFSILLLISSIILILSRTKFKIRPLQNIDWIIFQYFIFILIFSYDWGISLYNKLLIVALGIVFFSLISRIEKMKILYNISIVLQNVIFLIIIVYSFVLFTESNSLYYPIMISIFSLISSLFQFFKYKFQDKFVKNNMDYIKDNNFLRYLTVYIFSSILITIFIVGIFMLEKHSIIEYSKYHKYLLLLTTLSLIFARNKFTISGITIFESFITQVVTYVITILLVNFGTSPYTIISLIYLETIIFSINYLTSSKVLFKLNFIVLNITIFLNIVFYLYGLYEGVAFSLNKNILFLINFIATIISALYLYKALNIKEKHQKDYNFYMFNLLGFFIGTLPVFGLITIQNTITWAKYINGEYIILLPVISLLYLRQKKQLDGLGIGLIVTLILSSILNWGYSYNAGFTIPQQLLYSLPIFVISGFYIAFSYIESIKKHLTLIGIYALFANLAYILYFILKPASPMIVGILWLLLSIVIIEITSFLKKSTPQFIQKGQSDFHLIVVCYSFIFAFIVRHLIVHLQSEKYLFFGFKARLLIEIFALLIFIYWFIQEKDRFAYKLYNFVQPLFLEIIIAFLTLTIIVEVRQIFHPLIWTILAIISLTIGFNSKTEKLSRLQFYSILYYWASCFHVAFITSPYVTAKINYFSIDWIISVVAIFFQFIYIGLFYIKFKVESLQLPSHLNFYNHLLKIVNFKRNLWIYYPLFVSVALFLIWSFDRSILTLLLTFEAFSVFILSIILIESNFKYLSYLALLACLARLIFYDLAKSNTLTKAIVCIGVALVMLLMNAIYNKYKERFKKNEKI